MLAKDLAKRLADSDAPLIVDVRSLAEYRAGHIPGAVHVPFWGALFKSNPLPADKDAAIVLACEHGPRAQLAAGQLGLLGYRRVELLEGHMAHWRRQGLPLET